MVTNREASMDKRHTSGDGHALNWIVPIVTIAAIGLLGAGVYAVFFSRNGPGTVALLTIGLLALFVALCHDRIRSMEFGGAKIQLALKIKDWLKEAFELRLAGNYEQAEDTLQFAFREFAQESETRWKEYRTATEYQERVRKNLQKIVKGNDSVFNGRVRKTASGLSLLPLIDLVMDFDGLSVLEELTARGLTLCPELTEHLQQHKLRAGVIVRPGRSLNSEELIAKLGEEVKNGALRLTCFLLIQNCKGSESAKEFRSLAIQNGMHACSLEWKPYSGREKLADALQAAILTVCDLKQCISSSHATSSAGCQTPELPRSPGELVPISGGT
jgi:hypothetical protein